ncbi:protein RDM1 [Ricinus communis]|uniref:Protein RDM1 n=1 Tax=Ricinus communis TaxID=3988 RepID=B9RM31_RICCO|nr:protein RDM1 [Ricinus communis]EEF47354.1 conserved hypothetical protein [Ricinus communis]|eukprot:XP_002514800.1 protein RDM1 [Ricinus communis]
MALRSDHLYLTDSETESDDLSEYFNFQDQKRVNRGFYVGKGKYKIERNKKENVADGKNGQDMKALEEESEMKIRKAAEKYQQGMKLIPIPPSHASPILFITWQGLARSIKQKYEQPLHYLTMKLLKEWDQSRLGSVEERKPLEDIIDPVKAEATIWVVEHFHRQCSSPGHLSKLWLSDPTYQDFIDLNPMITSF